MSAGHHIGMPLASWEGIVALLTALGLGGVLTAWVQRPSRRAVDATAANAHATGEAAVITATASAFTEVTSGLREEIERLQRVAVTFEADLAAAHDRAVALDGQVRKLTGDLDRVRRERDAALEKAEQKEGEIRQLQQVISSLRRSEEIA
jgi:chromosome segregation ATPase